MVKSGLLRRLQPSLGVSEAFGLELRKEAVLRNLQASRIAVSTSYGQLMVGPVAAATAANSNDPTSTFLVPPCIHELYADWVRPGGQLAGLSMSTLARLAVDTYVAEYEGWRQRNPAENDAYEYIVPPSVAEQLVAAGHKPKRSAKHAGEVFRLTELEARPFGDDVQRLD